MAGKRTGKSVDVDKLVARLRERGRRLERPHFDDPVDAVKFTLGLLANVVAECTVDEEPS